MQVESGEFAGTRATALSRVVGGCHFYTEKAPLLWAREVSSRSPKLEDTRGLAKGCGGEEQAQVP